MRTQISLSIYARPAQRRFFVPDHCRLDLIGNLPFDRRRDFQVGRLTAEKKCRNDDDDLGYRYSLFFISDVASLAHILWFPDNTTGRPVGLFHGGGI